MSNSKLTKRDYFALLRARVADDDALVAFIDHEVALLDKKNASRSDKPTAKQVANSALMSAIYDAMEPNKAYTATDISALVPDLADAKIQKVSALITKMRENVLVSREVVKGRAYFTKI